MKRFLLLLPLLFTVACYDIYTAWPAVADTAAFREPLLLGNWSQPGKDSGQLALSITVGEGKEYRIALVGDKGETDTLIGLLGRAGSHWILDLQRKSRPNESTLFELPVHYLVAIKVTDSSLAYAYLETGPFSDANDSTPPPFQVVKFPDGNLLLTDGTTALRAGLSSYLDRPDALSSWEEFRRWKPTFAQAAVAGH